MWHANKGHYLFLTKPASNLIAKRKREKKHSNASHEISFFQSNHCVKAAEGSETHNQTNKKWASHRNDWPSPSFFSIDVQEWTPGKINMHTAGVFQAMISDSFLCHCHILRAKLLWRSPYLTLCHTLGSRQNNNLYHLVTSYCWSECSLTVILYTLNK